MLFPENFANQQQPFIPDEVKMYRILEETPQPCLPECFSCFNDQGVHFIIMKLYSGNLRELLDEVEGDESTFQENIAKNVVFQILRGISFINKHDFVHRDIKPENILLLESVSAIMQRPNDPFSVVVADFGSARMLDTSKRPFTPDMITLTQRPPEAFSSAKDHFYVFASDVWSVGAIFLEMITGEDYVLDKYNQATKHLINRYIAKWARQYLTEVISSLLKNRLTGSNCIWWEHHFNDLPKIYSGLYQQVYGNFDSLSDHCWPKGKLSKEGFRVLCTMFEQNAHERPSAGALLENTYWNTRGISSGQRLIRECLDERRFIQTQPLHMYKMGAF